MKFSNDNFAIMAGLTSVFIGICLKCFSNLNVSDQLFDMSVVNGLLLSFPIFERLSGNTPYSGKWKFYKSPIIGFIVLSYAAIMAALSLVFSDIIQSEIFPILALPFAILTLASFIVTFIGIICITNILISMYAKDKNT